MKLAVPTETRSGEHRVAIIPDVAGRLAGTGVEVVVQEGAGAHAHFPDAAYVEKGATIRAGAGEALAGADLVAKVQAPTPDEVGLLVEGITVVSFFQPAAQLDTVRALAQRKATAFSLDLVPRISRAQSMDALSSQATVSGYLSTLAAAVAAAQVLPHVHDRGGHHPARQGARARRRAWPDCRPSPPPVGSGPRCAPTTSGPRPKKRCSRSGPTSWSSSSSPRRARAATPAVQSEEFLARQRELISNEVAAADVVITTAAVPGRQAPVLVTTAMVERMVEGSVIVDMAADSGGNCELERAG